MKFLNEIISLNLTDFFIFQYFLKQIVQNYQNIDSPFLFSSLYGIYYILAEKVGLCWEPFIKIMFTVKNVV